MNTEPRTPKPPFAEVWPRTPARDQLLFDAVGSTAPLFMLLAALYLSTGRYTPPEAKRSRYVGFGFCDAAGTHVETLADATHIGWTLHG